MAIPEKKEGDKKVDPPVDISKCAHVLAAPSPDEYGPMVTVAVGPASIACKFYVHKGLLTHYSSYFKAALKKNWKEGATKMVELEDDNPEVFRTFFHWLYTRKLYSNLDSTGKIPLTFRLIVEIYIFGDARGAPGLCNAAMDVLFQKFHQDWQLQNELLNYIYDFTLPESPLRKAFVDMAIETNRFRTLRNARDRALDLYPKDYFADLVTGFMALGSSPIPSSAGFGANLPMTKANWVTNIKPLLCQRYHDHPKPES